MFVPKLIVFDLNKTLINENSWLNLNLAMGVTQEEDDMLMRWWEQGVIDDQQGQDILCELYKVRGEPSRQNIQSVVGMYSYKQGAKELVAHAHQKGYSVALISGAMDVLVQHVAKELTIRHWRAASHFIFDDNNMLTNISCAENDAEHKALMLHELCTEMNILPGECMAVGDGDNDARLFEMTGHGITFKDSKITSLAEHVVTDLSDIQALI